MSEIFRIKAEKWVNNGLCLGYLDNVTYFISGAIPGEEVICELIRNTSRMKLLNVIEIVQPSALRIQPDCDVFLKCGGCQFRHLEYSEELQIKEKLLRQELNFSNPMHVISGDPDGYRNNVQLKKDKQNIGFYKTGSNDLVNFPKNGCRNLSPELNSYILKNVKQNSGKEIKFRSSDEKIVDYSKNESAIQIGENKFRIPPNGFFQINRFLTLPWLQEIISLLPGTKEKFLELFSGCGLISVSIAKHIHSAICLEVDNSSVEYSKTNSKLNKKQNLLFNQKNLYADLGNDRKTFSAKYWIANPPRNGLGPKIISAIEKFLPDLIIYSSCNYVTLSHDMKKISSLGYKISHVSLIDFFPRTHYFESLVKIEKVTNS